MKPAFLIALVPYWVHMLLVQLQPASADTRIVQLDESNWRQMLKGEWMVEFYAPWCPACRQLHATWSEFAEWTDDLGLAGVAQVSQSLDYS